MGEQRRRYSFLNGVARSTVYDDDGGKLHVGASQNVEPILDSIHRDREIMRHGKDKVVARLPTVIVEDLIKREIYDDELKFKKWLNSPEATPWRIWRGQL